MLLVAVPLGSVPAQSPPPGPDWAITTDTYLSDETLYMNLTNITVRAPATLDLRNVTLLFNSTDYCTHGIMVEKGATLRTLSSTCRKSWLSK